MPLYEYLCESCGRTIELIQSYSEPRLTICDRCGGPMKRLVSAPAVQFKGSGWYVSDYGKGGSDSRSRKKSEGLSAASSDGAGASEKPAASEGKTASSDKPASSSAGSSPSSSSGSSSGSTSASTSGSTSGDKKS